METCAVGNIEQFGRISLFSIFVIFNNKCTLKFLFSSSSLFFLEVFHIHTHVYLYLSWHDIIKISHFPSKILYTNTKTLTTEHAINIMITTHTHTHTLTHTHTHSRSCRKHCEHDGYVTTPAEGGRREPAPLTRVSIKHVDVAMRLWSRAAALSGSLGSSLRQSAGDLIWSQVCVGSVYVEFGVWTRWNNVSNNMFQQWMSQKDWECSTI